MFNFIFKSMNNNLDDTILIKRHKAIYFPIPKVACTSLKYSMLNWMGKRAIDPENPYYKIHTRKYPSVNKNIILDKYSEYYRFCFIRNPWDRLVSCYKNKIKQDSKYNDNWFKNGVAKSLLKHKNKFKGGMSFSEFIETVCYINDDIADPHLKSQYKFIYDSKDRLLVNFIGRFESLEEDYLYICKQLSIKDIPLPHMLKSNRSDYKEYYNDKLISLVYDRYAKDIRLFKYNFD